MAEKKVNKPVKIPTEKQVTLLEMLMVHELQDVQKKALAIVLSIWKKKTIQQISYIIPELTEKQIRYAAQDTQYLFQIKDKLISMLQREDRLNLYNKCVKMIPTLVEMEIRGYKISTFDH